MFGKGKVLKEGVPAQALVLEKFAYSSGYSTGRTKSCRFKLRVKFEDGTTAEISRNAWTHKTARAVVGDLVPVRYDPGDRSKVEIDGNAMEAQYNAAKQEIQDQAITDGEKELDQS